MSIKTMSMQNGQPPLNQSNPPDMCTSQPQPLPPLNPFYALPSATMERLLTQIIPSLSFSGRFGRGGFFPVRFDPPTVAFTAASCYGWLPVVATATEHGDRGARGMVV